MVEQLGKVGSTGVSLGPQPGFVKVGVGIPPQIG